MNVPADPVSPDIRHLVSETVEILGWLARLDEVGRSVRPEIVARIRRDYDARLRAATERLIEHRPDLAETAAAREEALAALREEMAARAADLEELGLRHEIGELGETELKARRAPVERSIETLEAQIEQEKDTVAVLGGILQRLDDSADPEAATVTTEPITVATESAAEDAATGPDPATVAAEPTTVATEPATAEEPSALAAEGPDEADPPTPAQDVAEVEAGAHAGNGTDAEDAWDAEDAEGAGNAEDGGGATGGHIDELDFLQSLSSGDGRFDGVSSMLPEDLGEEKPEDGPN